MMRTPCSIAFLVVLTACGSGSQDGVGGVSAGEARALNEAAAKLDLQADDVQGADPALNPAAVAAAGADRKRTATAVSTP